MDTIISILDATRQILRTAYVIILAVTAVAALIAWLARSRRISPFSPFGRVSRRFIEPALAPVDRIILRAGGTGTATPLWSFVLVLFLGAAAIFVVTVLRDGAITFSHATSRGAGGIARLVVAWTFGALQLALLVRVLTSWLGGTHSAVGRLAARMTEWFLTPLRNVLPPFGNIDLSPLVAWFLLSIIQGIVMRAL